MKTCIIILTLPVMVFSLSCNSSSCNSPNNLMSRLRSNDLNVQKDAMKEIASNHNVNDDVLKEVFKIMNASSVEDSDFFHLYIAFGKVIAEAIRAENSKLQELVKESNMKTKEAVLRNLVTLKNSNEEGINQKIDIVVNLCRELLDDPSDKVKDAAAIAIADIYFYNPKGTVDFIHNNTKPKKEYTEGIKLLMYHDYLHIRDLLPVQEKLEYLNNLISDLSGSSKDTLSAKIFGVEYMVEGCFNPMKEQFMGKDYSIESEKIENWYEVANRMEIWYKDNKNYLYWDNSKKSFMVNEEAKAKGIPVDPDTGKMIEENKKGDITPPPK